MYCKGDVVCLGLGRYTLDSVLAQAQFGEVWRAQGPHGAVALKLLQARALAAAPPAVRRHWVAAARNEARFLGGLDPWDGRHLVRLLDSGSIDGLPALALELLDTDLARHTRLLRSLGCTPAPRQLLAWLGQINQALERIHHHGWRHLDLKPANVLLDLGSGQVKLSDFGTNRPQAVRLHSYAGTPHWQAPEQLLALAPDVYHTDARTDYFAFGALFYYLVTGGQPLRFGAACAAAWRARPDDPGAALRAQHGGALPPTLREDEAALFRQRLTRALEQEEDCAAPRAAVQVAEQLLRALLAAAPAARPPHALAIGRQLLALRTALALAPRRQTPAVGGWLARLGVLARAGAR
ncbi:protein kinase [Massilia sp. TS11]|uniref:protein kinase domain-containing protein n=1 Tax=Massilia sp. TS11 TaxID=2908003 RepID=UPI001EDA26C7|nr:protein kinase [Massilia sp. TS11]MCG2584531.1 protein kinase [Massilia sp. TS11]